MRNSAYEHQIPEQLFSTETEQAEGVSTAKALALAMAQGQRIYTLTASNASQLNNITIDDGARVEIQQALAQGLEVTVHQAPITVNGWQGSGYAILNADYGVGAYKISGGSSGGFLNKLKFWAGFLLSFIDNKPVRGLVLDGILAGIGVIVGLITNGYDLITKCANSGFALGLITILAVVSIMFEVLLILSGVGFAAGLLLGLVIGRLETAVIDYFIENNPLCKGS